MGGCGDTDSNRPPAPGGGPARQDCDRPNPPRGNLAAQADNCGVSAIEIVRPHALAVAPRVGIVNVELYIDQAVACAVNGLNGNGSLCAVGDNRPFTPEGARDPRADPSRDRVYGTLDFTTGTVTFRVNPSCSVPNGGGKAECFAPHPDGEGSDVSISRPSKSSTRIEARFSEAAYPTVPGHACTINEDLRVAPDNASGDVAIIGTGSTFPSIGIVHNGRELVAKDGLHLTSLCLGTRQTYEYIPAAMKPTATAPPPAKTSTPTATPTAQPSSGCGTDPCATSNGVTVILTSIHRSSRNNYGDDLAPQRQFFVRMGVRIINRGSGAVTADNLHFQLTDSRHIVDQPSDEGYGSRCGLSGNADPGLTLAAGADERMPESLCFEPHGSIGSSFVVAFSLDTGGEVNVKVP